MKIYTLPRWVSSVAFALGKPAFWFWNRVNSLGIWLRDSQFQPGRFTCRNCGRPQFGVCVHTFSYHGETSPRVCRRCYDDVPF